MATTKRTFKRPFQPSISSYFGHSPSDPERSEGFSAPQTSILSPTLPATIQSSLLNVGMRVRKSVPEGYKTRPKTFCGSAAPTWNNASSYQANPIYQHSRNPRTSFTGLVPYCGILKVGGHQAQPVPPAEQDLPPLQFDHEEAWDLGFPSSQGSISSYDSLNVTTPVITAATSAVNKRRREDADEEDLDIEAQPVSPRSRPVSHTPMPNLDAVRPIAVPKTRRKTVYDCGINESEMIDVGDFGEAEFLRPVEWGGGLDGF